MYHTTVSRIERELGGLEECVYCCGQYMVRLQTRWRYITNLIWNCRQPRDGWVWPVEMQRGNMCARRDDYGGDAAKHLKGIQVYASNTFLTIIKDNLIQA